MSQRRVQVAGLGFRVVKEGVGAPVLLLHGFPDSADLWRHQIQALADAGFRVVAPDLRGFGESDKPQDVESYMFDTILADITGIMDASDVEAAHVVAHDWGAVFGWALAAFQPARVKSLVALSVGHPAAAIAHVDIAQREKSWYMLLFQFPVAEQQLRADDWKLFRELVRHHPELDRWIPALERPGALTAALNWYRALAPPEAWSGDGFDFPLVSVPTLGIWSTGDAYINEKPIAASGQHVRAPWRYERIEDASHWMQLDQPDRINQLLLNFLRALREER